jgi:low affinity Fe/Cu permease
MSEDQCEYVDQSLRDRVYQRRSFYNDNDKTTLEQERYDEIPEEIMSRLENHIGDGLARVTVAGDLGSSVSYHSAKAFVSVSVTCNNDLDDVAAVHDTLRPFVQNLCHDDHEEMAAIRDSIIRDGVANPRRATQELEAKGPVRQPPKRGGPKKSVAPKKGGLKRGGRTVTPKGVKKPSFRR